MVSHCRSRTTVTTPPCRLGRCAPFPTRSAPWASCDGSSSPVRPCTSSSTGWPRTSKCAAGNTASTRCSRGCWRLPPHPANRRPAQDRGLHHHRTRRLLRKGRSEAHGRRLPGHRAVSLASASGLVAAAWPDGSLGVTPLGSTAVKRGKCRGADRPLSDPFCERVTRVAADDTAVTRAVRVRESL